MNDQSGETREETIINALREVTSETLVATLSLQPTTVPVKCKLTVTRNSNDSTRSSKLEYFEYQVSSRVVRVLSRVVRVLSRVVRVSSRVSSRVVRVSSREDKEFIA